MRLADALNHLYVLLPVLDDAKHYWVSTDEVDKLVRAGGDWLAGHPEKALITKRYLAHRRGLTESALARLAESDDTEPEALDNAVAGDEGQDAADTTPAAHRAQDADTTPAADRAGGADEGEGAGLPAPATGLAGAAGTEGLSRPLAVLRRETVLTVLREAGVRSVADLGCGSGVLTRDLLAVPGFGLVVAADVSAKALGLAVDRLRLDRMTDQQRARLRIFQSALTYRDDRLADLDAAVLMEVIEHVDPGRLPAVERVVFGFAAPRVVVVTTPNAEYNVRYETLPDGAMRHPDHRFEWTRAQFRAWADRVAGGFGYRVRYLPVGPEDGEVGPPTQLALFEAVHSAKPGLPTPAADPEGGTS